MKNAISKFIILKSKKIGISYQLKISYSIKLSCDDKAIASIL